jgi:hypothetical protein
VLKILRVGWSSFYFSIVYYNSTTPDKYFFEDLNLASLGMFSNNSIPSGIAIGIMFK